MIISGLAILIGSLVVLGVTAASSAIQGGINYGYNSALQEDSQEFNAEEAAKARDWEAEQAEITRNYNSAEAEKNRQYQTYMSNTAYQRQVADMQKAGINPAYAGQTQGALTTATSAATSGMPSASVAHDSPNYVNTGQGQLGLFENAMKMAAMTKPGITAMAQAAKGAFKLLSSRGVILKYADPTGEIKALDLRPLMIGIKNGLEDGKPLMSDDQMFGALEQIQFQVKQIGLEDPQKLQAINNAMKKFEKENHLTEKQKDTFWNQYKKNYKQWLQAREKKYGELIEDDDELF